MEYPDIRVGMVFDTPYETNCVVSEVISGEYDVNGNFGAYDSEGYECTFNVVMVQNLRERGE